jgi:phosphatidylglycerol:prolipoprotein diacylglycerol transferase
MIPYPQISPTLVEFGPLGIRWYGLMYVTGFTLGYTLLKRRAREGLLKLSYAGIESFVTHLIIGMLLGARITYVLVYNWDVYREKLHEIFYIWQGGLSFHGALIGMTISCLIYSRKQKLPFYMVTDAFAFAAAPGLFFGRMGNFINAELYGRPTTVPWAMIFPTDPERLPRHPSQLYQGITEGVFLYFVLLWTQRRALREGRYRFGLLSAVFLIGYAIIRFLVEFTREPDAQLGFVLGSLSMGQILCALMGLAGVFVAWHHRQVGGVIVPKPPTQDFLEGPG